LRLTRCERLSYTANRSGGRIYHLLGKTIKASYAFAVTTQLRYERWFIPFSVPLGCGPKRSEVRIEDGALHVKFGWGFRTAVPLSSITKAEPNHDRVYAWGAHGWRGRWLVNGSSKGVVELTIDPPTRAYVMGVPITLRTLWVSVTDPDALIEACTRKV
jgi:hypothetical protein